MSKVRNGFVSNSSSSSFLIYGTSITNSELEKMEDFDGWKFQKSTGLSVYDRDYETYIGESWDNIGDDETGKQFKERVEKKILEHFPEAKFGTFEDAWYDG